MKRSALIGAAVAVAVGEALDLHAQDYDVKSSLRDLVTSPLPVAVVATFGAAVGAAVEALR